MRSTPKRGIRSHDLVLVKGSLGHDVENFGGDALAPNATIEPVEGLGPTVPFIHVDADLADASVSGEGS